jgi:RsiW-degrading membrane proteinase PrsW (M82 family)
MALVFRLRIASGPRAGETFLLPDLPTSPVLIGRGHEVHLRIAEDQTLSRQHCELRLEKGEWVLHNKSQHGTHVGARRIDTTRPLVPGDILTVGETQVAYEHAPSGRPGRDDPLTPTTPTIALAPAQAGFDTQGVFHMGQTMLGVEPDIEGSFLHFGGSSERPAIKVKTRAVYFFLVVGILGLAGCLSTGVFMVLPTLLDHPTLLLQATAFGLLPAIPYVVLIKLLDSNDQVPWKNYLSCVVWGATVGCGFSLVLNAIGGSTISTVVTSQQAFNATAVFVAPLVEEVVKGLSVLFVFWLLHDEFDNVVEGMLLGAASGLGFALVENSIYNVEFLKKPDGAATLLTLGTYRIFVNALIGHPVYTAMTGMGLGLLREAGPRAGPRRLVYPVIGLGLAIGLHLVWNAAAVLVGSRMGNTGLMLVANAFVFGGAGFLCFVGCYLFARARERRVLLTYLAEEVEKGFVTREELHTFERLLGRQRWELAGIIEGGRPLYRLRRELRHAQVELAFRKWHLAQGDAPRGTLVDAYVLDARTRIRDARNKLRSREGLAAATMPPKAV